MKILKKGLLTLSLFTFAFSSIFAQDSSVTLEFKNSESALNLVQNYIKALQEGNVDKMNAALSKDAMIYGLGGALDSLNIAQHKDYFNESLSQYKHSITRDLYLPVKVENNWNEGEWILAWGTNSITNKETKTIITVPYHTVSLVENGKIKNIYYYYDMLNVVESQGFTLTPPKN